MKMYTTRQCFLSFVTLFFLGLAGCRCEFFVNKPALAKSVSPRFVKSVPGWLGSLAQKHQAWWLFCLRGAFRCLVFKQLRELFFGVPVACSASENRQELR
jgi:hypothetical protein